MKFQKDNLTILCKPGETITLNVTALGTDHSVVYKVGEQNNVLPEEQSLVIDASNIRSPLVMNFGYSSDKGGRYNIEIAGSSGGNTKLSVPQAGELSKVIAFSLEGDRDTDYE